MQFCLEIECFLFVLFFLFKVILIICVRVCVLRSKEVDWQPYFTTRLVDDFATHLRVFRKAQDRLADREDKQSKQTQSYTPAFHSRSYILHVACL